MTDQHVVYTYQDVETLLGDGEVEWKMLFTWTPIREATYWDPAEGGIDDYTIYRDGKEVTQDTHEYYEEYEAELLDLAGDYIDSNGM